jgi:hypothetical protein
MCMLFYSSIIQSRFKGTLSTKNLEKYFFDPLFWNNSGIHHHSEKSCWWSLTYLISWTSSVWIFIVQLYSHVINMTWTPQKYFSPFRRNDQKKSIKIDDSNNLILTTLYYIKHLNIKSLNFSWGIIRSSYR